MRKEKIAGLILLLCSFIFTSFASAEEISFDDVASFTVIDNQYAGISLSTYGMAGYSDGHAYARSSSLSASSPNVIAGNRPGYTYLNDAYIVGVAEFSSPVNYAEIYARPYTSEYLFAWMKAYDNSGNLVGAAAFDGSSLSASTLFIADINASIAKVEFAGSGKRVVFDNLSYAVAPEPVSAILFLLGGVALAAGRRLKK